MSDPITIDNVKEWFSPLEVLNTKFVIKHLTSLSEYGDKPVKSPNQTSTTAWTKIFGECLSDVKVIPDDDALTFVTKYRTEFKEKCGKSDDELNKMTKKEFVYLFAIVMPNIFNEEKERLEKEEKERLDKENKLLQIQKNNIQLQVAQEEATADTYKNDMGWGGGSKNKSRKRSTRKPRSSRRHRRRTTTRKYKKLYK